MAARWLEPWGGLAGSYDPCRVKLAPVVAAQVNRSEWPLTSRFVVPCCPRVPESRGGQGRPTQALAALSDHAAFPILFSNLCSICWRAVGTCVCQQSAQQMTLSCWLNAQRHQG